MIAINGGQPVSSAMHMTAAYCCADLSRAMGTEAAGWMEMSAPTMSVTAESRVPAVGGNAMVGLEAKGRVQREGLKGRIVRR